MEMIIQDLDILKDLEMKFIFWDIGSRKITV